MARGLPDRRHRAAVRPSRRGAIVARAAEAPLTARRDVLSITAVDAALALAAIESITLVARTRITENLLDTALLPLAAFAASLVFVVPCAIGIALLPPRPPKIGLAISAVAAVLLAGSYTVDASQYVRLYPKWHVLLGLVAALGTALVRAGLPIRKKWLSARVVGAIVGLTGGVLAIIARYDVREYARTRGVILGDVLDVVLPSSPPMPPIPNLPAERPREPRPLAARPRLILLLTVDALRAEVVDNARGNTFATLRDATASFSAARSVASATVPALYGLMTARGPWHVAFERAVFNLQGPIPYHGTKDDPRAVWPMPLHDTSPTLAEALAKQGYRTSVCASIPFQGKSGGLVRGFETVDERVYRERNSVLTGITSDMLTACGISMLDAAKDQPLLLWLHYCDTHAPYDRHPETPARGNTPRQRYDGEVAFEALHLAGLLNHVQERIGLANTLLVLTADHGEEFGEHGGEYHGATLMDEVIRVPLLIGSVELPPRKIAQSVSILDITPTILELVGAPPLPAADGRSLVPLLRGETLEPRPVFAELYRADRPRRVVVDGRYKLVYGGRSRGYALYDLVSDPEEQVVATDAHLDVVRKLSRELGVPEPSTFP